MSKRQDERILMEIFIRFLKKTEGITYEVTGEDVPNRTGVKNFDYLLRAQSNGSTMALEITLISDDEEDFEKKRLTGSVLSCLDKTIQKGLPHLPCAMLIELPFIFNGSMRELEREAESVATKILDSAKSMVPNQKFVIESSLGLFKVQLLEEGSKGLSFCSSGQETWATHSSDVARMCSMLERRLTGKNEQLNTDADRKVILIGRVAGIIDRDAISHALAELRGGFSNIGELYVCYGDGDVQQSW